jgi:hypothetical protein
MRHFTGRTVASWAILTALCIAAFSALPSARKIESLQEADNSSEPRLRSAKVETTWIFDADFEDFEGDNWGTQDLGQSGDELTGWYTSDRSGGRPQGIYWHKDTLLAYPDSTPPDTSMWCGTCDGSECWVCECGYGNEWTQHLVREIDLTPYDGDTITLRFRQQFNLERDYDHGYVDVSADGGENWSTKLTVSNPGFGYPGCGQDWESATHGHPSVELSPYGGGLVLLRWRVETDWLGSNEDYDPLSCFETGAWFIDEVEILIGSAEERIFYANFEDPSNPDNTAWSTTTPALENTGIMWSRMLDPPTGNDSIPIAQDGWMLTAVNSSTYQMVDDERCYLYSPIITLAGEDAAIIEIKGWKEFSGNDVVTLYALFSDSVECMDHDWTHGSFVGHIDDGPAWGRWVFSVDNESQRRYARFILRSWAPTPTAHKSGLYLNGLRVGVLGAQTHAGDVLRVRDDDAVEMLVRVSPNPSNGELSLSVEPAVRNATVAIYNILGEVMFLAGEAELENGHLVWDGLRESGEVLPSGVYFVRVVSQSGIASKKIVLLR